MECWQLYSCFFSQDFGNIPSYQQLSRRRRVTLSSSLYPRPQLTRPKAVCLHGFRSNGDALAAQMGPLISGPGRTEHVVFRFFLEFSSISWIRGGFAIRIFLRFLESKNLCQNAFPHGPQCQVVWVHWSGFSSHHQDLPLDQKHPIFQTAVSWGP